MTARREGDSQYRKLSKRFGEALVAGSALAAEEVADRAFDVGGNAAAVDARVIAPAMWMIGELWERGKISVADEHLATAISQQIAARLFTHMLVSEPRARERVILAGPQGEQHTLALRMAADVLEGAGYEVMYLGSDVPLESLLQSCERYRPAVVGFTVSLSLNVPTLLWEIEALARLDQPPAVMVGGRALAPAIDQGLSASIVPDTEHVVSIIQRLIAAPTRGPYVAPALAARVPRRGPVSSISSEAIGTIPDAFSRTALVAADAVRNATRHSHAMERLAYRDELTGLYNRRACDDKLLRLLDEDGPPTAVLMLDVDKFKTINDTHGHEAGDTALVRVAKIITGAIRPGDCASRFGGDEFMVLLPATNAERSAAVAERIRATVEENLLDPPVTVSIGVAMAGASSLATRRAVDDALYRAKETGRNQISALGR